MFDLSSLYEKTDSIKVALKHPLSGEELKDKDGNVCKVVVYGRASKRFQDYQTAKMNRLLKEKSTKKVDDTTYEQLNEAVMEALVVCVDCFENMSYEGKPLDNETTIKTALSNPALKWLLDQTHDIVNDQSNFF